MEELKNNNDNKSVALLNFRQEYLKDIEKGGKIVKKYDKELVEIVERICSDESWEIYNNYINEVIDRCKRLVKLGEYQLALKEYNLMVMNLRKGLDIKK